MEALQRPQGKDPREKGNLKGKNRQGGRNRKGPRCLLGRKAKRACRAAELVVTAGKKRTAGTSAGRQCKLGCQAVRRAGGGWNSTGPSRNKRSRAFAEGQKLHLG